jgi:hypothetical protein
VDVVDRGVGGVDKKEDKKEDKEEDKKEDKNESVGYIYYSIYSFYSYCIPYRDTSTRTGRIF